MWGTPAEYDYLLLCDGSQISAELYPELVKVLGGNTLPDLVGRFLEGAGSAGEYRAAGLPNIEGRIIGWGRTDYVQAGALIYEYPGSLIGVPSYNSSATLQMVDIGIKFDASKSNSIYGSSTTVQPKSMTVKYYICYAG